MLASCDTLGLCLVTKVHILTFGLCQTEKVTIVEKGMYQVISPRHNSIQNQDVQTIVAFGSIDNVSVFNISDKKS
jgi:hypothetical protein